MNHLLSCISKKKYSYKCFVGDYHFKDINWVNWTKCGNDQPSLIDLIFTGEEMQVSEVTRHAPLGKNDHDVIIKFYCYLDNCKPTDKFVCEKADFEAMRRYLIDSNWEEENLSSGSDRNYEDLFFY